MTRHFEIGSYCFSIHSPEEMRYPENFLKFEQTDSGKASFTYTIDFVDTFDLRNDKPDFMSNELVVYQKDNLEERYFGSRSGSGYFTHYVETSSDHAEIHFLKSIADDLCYDTVFSSAFALEKHILREKQILLHCAYMEHNRKAILFSAPSETGKTTQANLWKKYRGTDQINGDRALLRPVGNEWHACGWPVCGSSGICFNKEMPIEAIVMLSQAPTNSIELLHPVKAFSQVYSQITINRWNNTAHTKAMDLIERLVGSVPVYHLACNISEDAVICLEDALS